MKAIRTYQTRIEAELGRITLAGAGLPCEIVGVDVAMEGGPAGVYLLVPDELVEAATQALQDAVTDSTFTLPE